MLKNIFSRPNNLKVKWFQMWHPELGEALETLPEMGEYPHELYRLVLQNPGPTKKRIALVTENGEPVAVVGIRNNYHHWEPVTHWKLPGSLFPARPGYIIPSLEALGLDVNVGWWRMQDEPAESRLMRYVLRQPIYRFCLSDNCETYWRSTGLFRSVRLTRNRCKDFTLAINAPGALEWTTRNWENRWRCKPSVESPDLADRLLIAQYLQDRGKYFSFTLLDKDKVIAGSNVIIHHKDVVASVNYRLEEYNRASVGERLIDLIFQWAQESGYETIDIGGDHSYKSHWAPEDGHKYTFNICPDHLYYPKMSARSLLWAVGNFTRKEKAALSAPLGKLLRPRS